MMEICLQKVGSNEREVLFRLLQYSLFEESATDQNSMGEDGLFSYPWFDCYFTEKEREAYFIREAGTGKLLGFVMINTCLQRTTNGHSIAEFMVLPGYRRRKIGMRAAVQCFEMHPGVWEVSPADGSEGAFQFWKNVIGEYAGEQVRYEDGIFLFCK